MIGQTLGHYRIGEKLGEGGMGVVYRAQDTLLGREVAIKALPEAFARDPERLARFRREAQLLASLNHPNIAAIHGLEEQDGQRYLVLEYVPGQTLAERLKRGSLPVEEALEICKQIAEAFEAAHEKGIIHRDLKPANVKVTPEGRVKVLDFGLAKAFEPEGSEAELSKSPTISMAATRAGVILGTAAYMSPEQARAKPVDKRTDIWAFGCVLYEALSGRLAFPGDTVSDNIAAILAREPDPQALPETTPPKIRDLLRRCLQKDPSRRPRDIGDLRIEIEEALSAFSVHAVAPLPERPARRGVWWPLAAILVLSVAITGVIAFWMGRGFRQAPPSASPRLTLALPAKTPLAPDLPTRSIALSPDGQTFVYVASVGGATQLYLRALNQFEPTPMPGTEGASNPFFSPDGQWVAFAASGKLKKVAITGGAALTICGDMGTFRGGTWLPDNTIVFSPQAVGGLYRVSAAGGALQPLTKSEKGEGHRWPEFLPGGQQVLFTVWRGSIEASRVAVVSLKTGERRILLEGGSYSLYAPTGHLVYARTAGLLAVPFDLQRLQVTGSPVPIQDGVMTQLPGHAQASLSADGTLVYVPGGLQEAERSLLSMNRKGQAQPLLQTRRAYENPRISPDGRRLAARITAATADIWVHEIGRESLTRLTFEAANWMPVWTPDGKRIAFSSTKAGGPPNLYWTRADGSGGLERLTTSDQPQFPGSWSPDGKFFAFIESFANTGWDIMILPLEGDRKPKPFLQTQFTELAPALSPDGRWLAYQSNESVRNEVYVQPFPGPGGKWQISTDGGTHPVWSRNGREIFYRNGAKVYAVAVQPASGFSFGKPTLLFEAPYTYASSPSPNYDVTLDGQHFVMIKAEEGQASVTQVNVILNWFEELKRRVPTEKK